jgi:hypothetical protein
MSRTAGSIVRGNFKAAPDIRRTGRQQVAGIYCQSGKRSRSPAVASQRRSKGYQRLRAQAEPGTVADALGCSLISRQPSRRYLQVRWRWNRQFVDADLSPDPPPGIPATEHGIIMASFRIRCRLAAAAFFLVIPIASFAQSDQGTPEQREACTPDAMRLCGAYLLDPRSVEACLRASGPRLSPACYDVFFPAQAAAPLPPQPLRGSRKRMPPPPPQDDED